VRLVHEWDMKKNLPYIIGFLLVCGVIFLLFRSCNLHDKNSVLRGQLGEAKNIAKADAKLKDALIAKQNTIIGQANKEIAEKDKAIGHMTDAIGQKDSDLTQLVQKLHGLEAVGDLAAQVANLKEQVAVWSSKFSLAQEVIAEKDKVIAAWAAKYDAQVTISESWKQKYEGETRLRMLAEKGWKASERRLRWTRVMSNVKSGLIVGALGYLGYSAIKGK